jgi:hypothetical protein
MFKTRIEYENRRMIYRLAPLQEQSVVISLLKTKNICLCEIWLYNVLSIFSFPQYSVDTSNAWIYQKGNQKVNQKGNQKP